MNYKLKLVHCLVLPNYILFFFYLNGTKVIPHSIYDLLTPIALAHLITGDGSARPHGLLICTYSYCVPEVVNLINVLIIKYRLDCTLQFPTPTQPRIYIFK